jgi:hypothetical protein
MKMETCIGFPLLHGVTVPGPLGPPKRSDDGPSKPGAAGSSPAGRAIRLRSRVITGELPRDGARVLLARRSGGARRRAGRALRSRRRRAGEPTTFVSLEHGIETPAGTVRLDVADQSRSMDQQLIDGWVDDRLRHALKHLPPSYRMVVVMREIEGLSTREVAVITGVSEANVKTRLHRARLMLRKQLEHI